mmetsp:Transcript_20007/g.23046  ORF Transcript_20007/g.23046 Transcript_20007/m.23046 type:complete len:140 (+) Transcript_20007:176-595(+)
MAIPYIILPFLLLAFLDYKCQAFAPSFILPSRQKNKIDNLQFSNIQKISHKNNHGPLSPPIIQSPSSISRSHTSFTILHNGVIIDVDDNFFTTSFFSIGLFYSLGNGNGEIFYKKECSGLFCHQGSRPRQKKFWDLNLS